MAKSQKPRLHGVYFILIGVGKRQHVFRTHSMDHAKSVLERVYPGKKLVIDRLAPVLGK